MGYNHKGQNWFSWGEHSPLLELKLVEKGGKLENFQTDYHKSKPFTINSDLFFLESAFGEIRQPGDAVNL